MDITRNFKDSAKAAAAYLAEQGIDVPHTRLLEALGRAFGERNWSTLRAQLTKLQGADVGSELPVAETLAQPPEWDVAAGAPMTDAQFVRYGGNRCPFCGSHDLDASGLQADGSIAWDHTECEECGSSWNTSYSVCGYFNGTASDSSPTGPDADKSTSVAGQEAVPALLRELKDEHGILLVGPSDDGEDWLAHVFRAKEALPILATLLDDNQHPTNLEELVAYATADIELAVDRLIRVGHVRPVREEARLDERAVRQAGEAAAEAAGLKLISGLRNDLIEELVDDVRDRARDYGFSYSGYKAALRLVRESAEVLDSDATEAEMFEAATRLA